MWPSPLQSTFSLSCQLQRPSELTSGQVLLGNLSMKVAAMMLKSKSKEKIFFLPIVHQYFEELQLGFETQKNAD